MTISSVSLDVKATQELGQWRILNVISDVSLPPGSEVNFLSSFVPRKCSTVRNKFRLSGKRL